MVAMRAPMKANKVVGTAALMVVVAMVERRESD
jgi:hypothetical protein